MKEIKKLQPNSLYYLSGKAVAKNTFFENKEDVLLAHRYIKRYLEGMMEIIEYLFTDEGWVLIVRTMSIDKIRKAYLHRRSRSKKAKKHALKIHPEEMISEHMRFFLSVLIKAINKSSGRTGTKVHSVFERYIFETKEEYLNCVDELREEKLEICEQSAKYKASKNEAQEIMDFMGKGDVLMCSKVRDVRLGRYKFKQYLIDLKELTNDVLGKVLNHSIFHYYPNSSLKKQKKPPD